MNVSHLLPFLQMNRAIPSARQFLGFLDCLAPCHTTDPNLPWTFQPKTAAGPERFLIFLGIHRRVQVLLYSSASVYALEDLARLFMQFPKVSSYLVGGSGLSRGHLSQVLNHLPRSLDSSIPPSRRSFLLRLSLG